MSKEWSYANLSKTASLNGGPEQFISTIEKFNLRKGVKKGVKIGAFGGVLATVGVITAGNFVVKKIKAIHVQRKEKRQIEQNEVEAAKAGLIGYLNKSTDKIDSMEGDEMDGEVQADI